MRRIKLDYITKIYGHASLDVKIRESKVKKAELNVFESSRFFEALVRNKKYDEIPKITSRICGICSASHNITSLMAIENAFGVNPSRQTRELRELLILGGWIQSHALHSYFLALPDYLGFSSILEMCGKYKEEVERAFRLKGLGGKIQTTIGGSSIHPLTTGINGFNKIPKRQELDELLNSLRNGRKDALETVKLFSSLKKPRFERKRKFIALKSKNEYAILSGDVGIGDRCLPQKDYRKNLKLEKRSYSTSKFVTWQGKEFMVGPLARLNINKEFLSKNAKKSLDILGISLPTYSPFDANLARVIEIVHCIDRSIDIINRIGLRQEENAFDFKKLKKKSYFGFALTEAPRGILHHSYKIDKKGIVKGSDIITPTAKNLEGIENDVKSFLPHLLKEPKSKIISGLEKLIRSYDPCISCSTHFLEVSFE